ncbi:MAG TPA: ferric reductase-like transmembrane domain-containing protein [Elusimicrobiota bacterium]|nr:ferric reductase-like transmembrane domain-containing protein [Elusimicrobiota bacterium]HMZ26637.1 ferric reductase-like transmembrane domain-containing protein [Elusimicrobiota bacterium]HNA60094.1 ferric reductase-like transmembrane domain-containing protein [Elusimicrobiota bacterium]HNC73291.1 ferric reductase-like transmembrane domain-containing protein [Elusimicrobiota bacterium]HND63430.1 ferric reductase-like transmembrane domain-containing protein [Elusimicrobiota bacterium]
MRGTLWFGFYLFLVVFPLILGVLGDPAAEPRPASLEAAVAAGYVGLALMAFEFALISRVRSVAGAFGQDALAQFHKQIGVVALLFVMVHPALLFFNGFSPGSLLNPFPEEVPGVLRWGMASFYAALSIVVLALGRKRFKIPYEWWQWSHSLLALAAVAGGLFHIFGIGNYTGSAAMKSLWAVYAAVLVGLTVRYRVVRPLVRWRRPWEVVENVPERGEAQTLVLRPVGHRGFAFEPGQFAWLLTGVTPFGWEQHPVSISSSAETPAGGPVSFTVKALGDWSRERVPALAPGRRLWLDGPYGVFSIDRQQGPGYVMIGGGVGITPLYSMCLTMADREDGRPVTLFYGSRRWEDVTFREGWESLSRRMNLKIVHVLEEAPAGWTGETGFITAAILQKQLPKGFRRFPFFVCGPPPLMDAMEDVLPGLGVDEDRIHTERFDMV